MSLLVVLISPEVPSQLERVGVEPATGYSAWFRWRPSFLLNFSLAQGQMKTLSLP